MSYRNRIRRLAREKSKRIDRAQPVINDAVELFQNHVKDEPVDEVRLKKIRAFFKEIHLMELELARLCDGSKREVVDSRTLFDEKFSNFVFHDVSINAYKQRQLSREGNTKPESTNSEK